MVYMYHSFLIHLSADGHLGCFHVLAIINSAAVNIGVHMSLSDLEYTFSCPAFRNYDLSSEWPKFLSYYPAPCRWSEVQSLSFSLRTSPSFSFSHTNNLLCAFISIPLKQIWFDSPLWLSLLHTLYFQLSFYIIISHLNVCFLHLTMRSLKTTV